MKRTVSLLLCAALILFTFAGCTQNEPEPTEAPTEPVVEIPLETRQSEKKYDDVQLQFLSMLDADDPRTQVIEQAVQLFGETTGAAVQVYWLGGNEDALAANFDEGIRMDIFAAPLGSLQSRFAEYALDLTQMAAAAGFNEKSYGVLRDQITEQCGYLAGIPQVPYVYGLYYNRAAFDESGVTEYPKTWEDFLNLSSTLVSKGYMPLTMDAEKAHITLELHLEQSLGAAQLEKLMTEGGWTTDAYYTELFRRAIEYPELGYLAKGAPSAFPSGQDKLALSNAAMVAGSNALCAQVEASAMMGLTWGVFPYPGDGQGTGYFVDSDVLAVHKDSANAQAAFDFIMLLTTGEFDQLYADLGDGIPADPANESRITNAQELLKTANPRRIGLLDPVNNELFTRLWNGWYKTARYFSIAMNGIVKPKTPEPIAAAT